MAIKPITDAVPVKNYISFSHRHSDVNHEVYKPQNRAPGLKRVPVICLFALSPLGAEARTPVIINLVSPKVEMVKETDNKDVVMYRKSKYYDGQKLELTMVSNDDNIRTYEKVLIRYVKDFGNRVGYMDGKLISITPPPNGKGDYLITYRPVVGDQLSKKYVIAKLPSQFGASIYNEIANSPYNNNAIGMVDIKTLYNHFGMDVVNNAKQIGDTGLSFRSKDQL